jgi:hypothetical protein
VRARSRSSRTRGPSPKIEFLRHLGMGGVFLAERGPPAAERRHAFPHPPFSGLRNGPEMGDAPVVQTGSILGPSAGTRPALSAGFVVSGFWVRRLLR